MVASALHLFGKRQDLGPRKSTLEPLLGGRILTTSVSSLKRERSIPTPSLPSLKGEPSSAGWPSALFAARPPLRRLLGRREGNLRNDGAVPRLACQAPTDLLLQRGLGFSCRRRCRKNPIMAFWSFDSSRWDKGQFPIQPQTGLLQQNRHHQTVVRRGRSWARRPLHLV